MNGIVIILLFIIASVLFPPLLIVIPFAIFGMMLQGFANLFKKEPAQTAQPKAPYRAPAPTAQKHTPVLNLTPKEEKQVQETGAVLVELINTTAARIHQEPASVAAGIRVITQIPFYVKDGKVNITEPQLLVMRPHLNRVRKYCDSLT